MLDNDCLSAPSTVCGSQCLINCVLTLLPGGNDVFVDIGDKSWGVLACQRIFGSIEGSKTLHVGDQFLSAGANDFKARLACTTAWIANPTETCQLLDEIAELDETHQRKTR
jgi:IMP and pyridine-specific 5'-nucleotidase